MRAKVRFLLFVSILFAQSLHAQFAWMPKPTHPNMTDFLWLSDQRVAYYEKDGWGLMDGTGKAVTPPSYAGLMSLGENLYGFRDKATEKWGVVDAGGAIIVKAEYTAIDAVREGHFRVQRASTVGGRTYEYNFITPAGKLTLPKFYKYLSVVQDGAAVFSDNTLFGYITPAGAVLIPEKFKNAENFRNGLAPAKMEDAQGWGFIDKKGQWVIQPQYEVVTADFKGNLLKVGLRASHTSGGSGFTADWGLIDRQGKVILIRDYTIIESPAENGIMLVKRKDLYGFVDGLGNSVTDCVYADASGFTKEGLARVKKDGKWGFISSKGTVVVPYVYDWADSYAENLAAVLKDGKWGFINTQGQLVIPHKFMNVTTFENGRSTVLTDTEVAVIDKAGNITAHTGVFSTSYVTTATHLFVRLEGSIVLFDQKGQFIKRLDVEDIGDFAEGLAPVLTDGYYGFINTDGNMVIPAKYAATTGFSDGLAAVQENASTPVYFIDKTGKKAFNMPEGYQYNGNFSEGMASVASNGVGGYIDKTGAVKVPAKYSNLSNFKNGMAIVVNSLGKQGFIDVKGTEVIPPAYDECGNMSEDGLAAVKINGLYGYVNRSGKLVIPAQYEVVANFVKGVAGVKKGGKVGYIDTKGNEIVPLQFEDGKEFFEDYAAVKTNGKWGFANLKGKGKLVIPATYDQVGAFSEDRCWVKMGDKVGCINQKGETVIPFLYDDAFEFKDGFAMVKKGDLYGIVDRNGKEIIPPACSAVGKFANGRVIAKVPASGYLVVPLK